MNLSIILTGCFFFIIKITKCQVTLNIDSPTYTSYVGSPLTITCNGTNLLTNDIVWQYYSLVNSTFVKVIYIYGQIVNGFRRKYSVSSVQSSPNEIMTSLTINDLDFNDSLYVYQCACNIYTACASGTKAKVEANITALPATTLKSLLMVKPDQQCFDGAYNVIQYIFLILNVFCLASITYIIVYQLHTSKIKFKIFVASMATVISMCLIIIIIYWMKPLYLYSVAYASLIIVCFGLTASFFCLSVIYYYSLRFWLDKKLKLVQILMITLDCILEILSAILLIIANIYCSGDDNLITIPALANVNFTYLEIAGACFLFIFGILLILKVLIFVILKNGSFILTTNFVKSTSS